MYHGCFWIGVLIMVQTYVMLAFQLCLFLMPKWSMTITYFLHFHPHHSFNHHFKKLNLKKLQNELVLFTKNVTNVSNISISDSQNCWFSQLSFTCCLDFLTLMSFSHLNKAVVAIWNSRCCSVQDHQFWGKFVLKKLQMYTIFNRKFLQRNN